jgi:hypothetical protein
MAVYPAHNRKRKVLQSSSLSLYFQYSRVRRSLPKESILSSIRIFSTLDSANLTHHKIVGHVIHHLLCRDHVTTRLPRQSHCHFSVVCDPPYRVANYNDIVPSRRDAVGCRKNALVRPETSNLPNSDRLEFLVQIPVATHSSYYIRYPIPDRSSICT